MHDFLLAKEITDEVLKVIEERKLKNISKVVLEIGTVSLAHNGLEEHAEDVSIENLEFGIRNLAKETILKDAKFDIKKAAGNNWKLAEIVVE